MASGLIEAFPAAREVFDTVDSALDENLSRTILEGPEASLTATRNAQPALLAASIAAVRALESRMGRPFCELFDYTAGHSLGEYSALVAAGSLDLADAARLLRLRGDAMQSAVPVGEGAMAAILGLTVEVVERLAAEAAAELGPCELANDNSDGQAVVSGRRAAVERAVELARDHGAKRALLLQVSAPFHCSLMAPAAEVLRPALDETSFRQPRPTLIANVSAAPVAEADRIPQLLAAQVTARVRWRETMAAAGTYGATTLVEFGPGRVLAGLAKRALPHCRIISVQAPEDVDGAMAALQA
jgi:[acyl-carrier-protein] S-malonyltransferase